MPVNPGIYKHYKGDTYIVVGSAHNSTNGQDHDEPLVLYYSVKNGPTRMNARKETEFAGTALVNDLCSYHGSRYVSRFTLVEAQEQE